MDYVHKLNEDFMREGKFADEAHKLGSKPIETYHRYASRMLLDESRKHIENRGGERVYQFLEDTNFAQTKPVLFVSCADIPNVRFYEKTKYLALPAFDKTRWQSLFQEFRSML